MKMIHFKAAFLCYRAGTNQCQKPNSATQHVRSANAKEHEQISHFRRLENVKILHLTCSRTRPTEKPVTAGFGFVVFF